MSTISYDYDRSYSQEYILNFYPDTVPSSLLSVDLKSQVSPEITFPLRLKPSKIYNIFEALFSGTSLKSMPTHKRSAQAIKIILGAGALIGRIPFIPLSAQILKNGNGFSTIYAIANFVSYSSFFIWAALRMVNRTIISLDVVRRGEDRRFECIQRAILIAFNLLNSAIAQTPLMYIAYKYNPEQPWVVALSVCDLFFPAYSMQMLYRKTVESCRSSIIETKLSQVKKDLIEAINYHQDCVKSQEVPRFTTNTSEHALDIETLGFFINHICCLNHHEYRLAKAREKKNYCDIMTQATGTALGLTLTACVLAWMGYIVYNMISSFSSNDAFIAIAIGYIVLWNAALLQDVLIQSSHDVLKALRHISTCKMPSSMTADYLWPNVAYSVKLSCLALAMFGAIPAVKASYDILPSHLQIPSSVLLALSLAFLSYRPMRELSHDMLCSVIKYYGDSEDKNQINYLKGLDLLKEYIHTADISETARFVLQLDPDLNSNPYVTKHKFQQDELYMYCRPS